MRAGAIWLKERTASRGAEAFAAESLVAPNWKAWPILMKTWICTVASCRWYLPGPVQALELKEADSASLILCSRQWIQHGQHLAHRLSVLKKMLICRRRAEATTAHDVDTLPEGELARLPRSILYNAIIIEGGAGACSAGIA